MATVKVWDWPLRLWHWSLAILVLIAWVTPNTYDSLHRFAGYVVIGLLAFRLVWGFFGSRHSRFDKIGLRLRAAPIYLRNLWRGETGRYLGLNPAGVALLVAMLGLLAISTVTGAMQVTVQVLWRVVDRGYACVFIPGYHRARRAARVGHPADERSSAREPDPRDGHGTEASAGKRASGTTCAIG